MKFNYEKNKSVDNTDAYDKELSELNQPYSKEELKLHQKDRELKSCLEMIHAHNWKLQMLAQKWLDYLGGKNARPIDKISKYVDPNNGPDINNACNMIAELITYMIQYGEGKCPKARIAIYCSKSTATLIETLSEIHQSKHLHRAGCAASKIFYYLTYHGDPKMTPEQYEKELTTLAAEFIKSCVDNAEELAVYTSEQVKKIEGSPLGDYYEHTCHPAALKTIESLLKKECEELGKQTEIGDDIRKSVNRIDTRDRKKHRKAKFTDKQLNTCHHYWELGKTNETLKSNTKVTYEAVFDYYKRELTAAGIQDAKMFRNALTNHAKLISKRHSRKIRQ